MFPVPLDPAASQEQPALFRCRGGLIFIGTVKLHKDQIGKRRIFHHLSHPYFHLKKTLIIVVRSGSQRKIVRCIGLYNDHPLLIAPSGSSGYLSNQLKGPFRRAIIRNVQTDVSRDYTDQTHIAKVKSLRHKLRTDQDISLSPRKISDDPVDLSLVFGGIQIEAFSLVNSSTFSVPAPKYLIYRLPQEGQDDGMENLLPQ